MQTVLDNLQMAQIFDLYTEITRTSDLTELANRLLPRLAGFLGVPSVFLYLHTPDLITPRFYGQRISEQQASYIKPICAAQLERLASLPASATTPRSWKASADFSIHPLRAGQTFVGLLGLGSDEQPIQFPGNSWDYLITDLANMCSALARQRKQERQLAYLNTYMTVSSMLAQSLGLHDMLETALYCCMEVVSAEAATVLLLDDEKKNFLFYQVEGPAKPMLMETSFPIGQGIAGSVLESRMSEVINQVQDDPRFFNQIDHQSGFQTRNMIALPLIAGEEPVGVLEVLNKVDGKNFTEEEHLSLMMIAEEIAFAVRNAKIFEYVVDSYCIQRQGLNTCRGCKRPLGNWTPCVKYRQELLV